MVRTVLPGLPVQMEIPHMRLPLRMDSSELKPSGSSPSWDPQGPTEQMEATEPMVHPGQMVIPLTKSRLRTDSSEMRPLG